MADEATVAPDGTGSQAWKRQRLIELGYGVADGLRLIPDVRLGSPRCGTCPRPS
jgi:hypothetical protein